MAVGQIKIVTFDDVLEYMSSHERTSHDKGDLWERVCAWYLRNDPEMQQIVGRVWRWDDTDNPLHTGHDTGIDIVAERTDAPGTYWAVQCKNFDTGHKVSLNDLGTFFAAAEADECYTGVVVATVSGDISSNVDAHLLALCQNRGITSHPIRYGSVQRRLVAPHGRPRRGCLRPLGAHVQPPAPPTGGHQPDSSQVRDL